MPEVRRERARDRRELGPLVLLQVATRVHLVEACAELEPVEPAADQRGQPELLERHDRQRLGHQQAQERGAGRVAQPGHERRDGFVGRAARAAAFACDVDPGIVLHARDRQDPGLAREFDLGADALRVLTVDVAEGAEPAHEVAQPVHDRVGVPAVLDLVETEQEQVAAVEPRHQRAVEAVVPARPRAAPRAADRPHAEAPQREVHLLRERLGQSGHKLLGERFSALPIGMLVRSGVGRSNQGCRLHGRHLQGDAGIGSTAESVASCRQ
jgi:hypothetical protein